MSSGEKQGKKKKSPSVLKGAHMFTIYKQVAIITDKVLSFEGSLKSLILGNSLVKNKALTFALCSQVLKYHKIIDHILQKTNYFKGTNNNTSKVSKKTSFEKSIVRVAMYECLFGQASKHAQLLSELFESFAKLRHPLFPKIKSKYYSDWNQALVQLKIEHNSNVTNNEDLLKLEQFSSMYIQSEELTANNCSNNDKNASEIIIDRYLRINTLKANDSMVIQSLKADGFPLLEANDPLPDNKKYIMRDQHIPELLRLFPYSTAMHEFSLVQNYEVIVQDKSSCMPVYILMQTLYSLNILSEKEAIREKFHFIDACAAPGNKTSYLAAKVALNKLNSDRMKIFAFDRDQKRIDILQQRLSEAGALENDLVEPIHQDFLTVDPNDEKYKHVRAILVDPSCSGSGIVGRGQSDKNLQRLEKLHNFQCTLLKHAFRFPNVQCVIYSTCSIHEIENEKTVYNVLNNQQDTNSSADKLFGLYKCFPEWDCRGTANDKSLGKYYSMDRIAPYVIRCYPKEHMTNGFFVSCFIRNEYLPEDEKVETFYNKQMATEGTSQQMEQKSMKVTKSSKKKGPVLKQISNKMKRKLESKIMNSKAKSKKTKINPT
jgi:putative methyltransferase